MFSIGALLILLLHYTYFKVPESPVWLESKARNESHALLPIIKKHARLCCYLVLLMTCFNFFSLGIQDLYPTFLKYQHHFDIYTVSIIAILYNIAAMLGGIFFCVLSEKTGRKRAIMCASALALPVLPLWAFASGSLWIGAGAFLMQFMVQGAWGVIPGWLYELVPANAKAVLPGFVYQLGNLIASVNATLQAKIADAYGGNYGIAMAIVADIVAVLILLLVFSGKKHRGLKFLARSNLHV